jgi:hypothetical protein
MKPIILAALVLAASGTPVQAQPKLDNPAEMLRTPESGPPALPHGDATTGPNASNKSVDPLPGSRQDWDLKTNEALLPAVPDVRPIPGSPPGSPLPQSKTR